MVLPIIFFFLINSVSRQRSRKEALGSDNSEYKPGLEFSLRMYSFESEVWGWSPTLSLF